MGFQAQEIQLQQKNWLKKHEGQFLKKKIKYEDNFEGLIVGEGNE